MNRGFLRSFAIGVTLFASPLIACDDGGTTEDTSTTTGAYSAIHTIFTAKCTPCHAGSAPEAGSGGAALGASSAAVSFDATQLDSGFAACAGKSKGECALIRIKDGSMPKGAGCDTDPNGAKCVTPAEQAVIEQWISAGMQE
jgi:hypothetical protein